MYRLVPRCLQPAAQGGGGGALPEEPAVTGLPRGPFLEGMRLIGATVAGTFAWGLITGVAMVKGGLSPLQAAGMLTLVFSGTAQLAALPLISAGASLAAIWATALLANLRFVVYSAVVAGEFHRQPTGRRLLLGWMTTDTGLAAYLAGQQGPSAALTEATRAARFLGANSLVYAGWTIGTAVGVAGAGWIPDSPQLGFMGVLAILALVGPMLVSRAMLGAAVAAALVALAGHGWPYHLGMFAAIAAGVVCALVLTPRPAGRPTVSRDA
jgi:predicted branched-subunit amino acid permease